MAAPPNFEEGQSTYRPPRFNGLYYEWWKTRMHDFIMAEDSELCDVICDGPHVPMNKLGETRPMVWKNIKEYSDIDRKAVEKNYRAKKILVCGIGPNEYNRISTCDSTKEIWKTLQTTHEGTIQVKQSKIDILTTEYELFRMKDDEFIQDIHTRFTSIINELLLLGDVIPRNKLVRKILSALPGFWESKVNAIIEAKDLQTLTMDELIGNLKTYEMKKKKDSFKRWSEEMVVYQKAVAQVSQGAMISVTSAENQGISSKTAHRKKEHYKQNSDKAAKRNSVPDKRFSQKSVADNIVKQALAAWGDSSSESEREPDVENSSMMAVEAEAKEYDSLFALMAQSDGDKEDENDEVNFRDVQRNLKSYSSKKLISLANVLIDAFCSLENDKEALTIELGDVEQSRDDLMLSMPCTSTIVETGRESGNSERKRTAMVHGQWMLKVHDWKNHEFSLTESPAGRGMYPVEMKTGYILGIGKVGKSLSHSIENVYYAEGLKHCILSISQICDKGNKVEFELKVCTSTNLVIGKIVLVAKRYKNIYVANIESLQAGAMSCLKAVVNDVEH
ncbi:uncharacterized protein LOC142177940 [Nicotiana tabacum]|uniref:Uncharacterized protein LOC142177940 n=1 Tax=Nicotiana tabacum TaxID=4097 RepID=A0AC58U0X2_TOBAC